MSIDTAADFDGMTRAGRVVAEALDAMVHATHVGMTTGELDAIGAAVLNAHGARSAPQLVYGCPAVNLISVNDEVVHGLPGGRVLQAGDVVKIDVTAETGGCIADAATTVVLPGAAKNAQRLRSCPAMASAARFTNRQRSPTTSIRFRTMCSRKGSCLPPRLPDSLTP